MVAEGEKNKRNGKWVQGKKWEGEIVAEGEEKIRRNGKWLHGE